MNDEQPSPSLPLLAASAPSLAQKAYDLVLDLLLRRELPPGAAIQERPLAERLDISRTPVREALNRLASEGFLTRRPGRLMVVTELSTRALIETLHVRQVLEVEAVGLACGRIAASELDALEVAILALLARERPSAEEDWAVDCRFHETIALAGGNRVLAGLVADLRLRTHMFNLHRVPERFEIGHREHLAVIAALRAGDREAAREGIRRHIENVRLSIVRTLSAI